MRMRSIRWAVGERDMPSNPIPNSGEPSPFFKMAILVIVMAILISALAAAFVQVTSAPLLTQPIKPHDWRVVDPNLKDPDIVYQDPDELDLYEENLGDEALFSLITTSDLAYLRTAVYDTYNQGSWTTEATFSDYNGSKMDIGLTTTNITIQNAQIFPIGKLYGGVPVVKQTFEIRPIKAGTVKYSEELGTFKSTEPISTNYTISYYKESVSLDEFRAAVVTQDPRYTQVPYELEARLKELTDFITAGSQSDYEKILSIRSYLRDNYVYDIDHPTPDSGTDPVEFFLFTSKEGICTYFNSALVLMLRSAGIPSRMVVGFMTDPTRNVQNVTASEAHAYAEVKFEGMDWTIVDALGWWDDLDRALVSVPSLELSGKVFQDDNGNGIDDDGHPLEFREVTVIDFRSNTSTFVYTDYLGQYSIHLWPGEYEVSSDMGEGWVNTTPGIVYTKLVNENLDGVDFGGVPILQNPTKSTVTNITSINSRAALMSRFSVVGTVTDNNSAPLSNLQVRVYVAKDKLDGYRYYCGKTWVQGGSFNASCIMPNIDLGTYQVIAQCVGNQEFQSSWSDPEIRVVDDTRILMTQANGQSTALPGQILSFQISVFGKYRGQWVTSSWLNVSTNESGYQDVESVKLDEFGVGYYSLTRFSPCDLTIKVSFNGSDDLIAASTRLAVHFGYAEVSMSTTKLVRGESNVLSGKATLRGTPLTGLPVFCRFGSQYGSTAQTDSKGAFAASISIPSQSELGSNDVEVIVEGYQSEKVQLRVVSRTTIEAFLSNKQVSAKLLDDHGAPISQVSIRLSSSKGNFTSLTDANGIAAFTALPSKSENLTILFLGTDEYLASRTIMTYAPSETIDSTWSLIALVCVSLFVVPAYVYLASGWRFKPPKMRKTPKKPSPKKEGPYAFEFPQIPKGLPPVWHQGESLILRILGKDGRVTINVDGKNLGELTLGGGRAEISLLLPLGKHQILVSGKEGRSEETVNVSLYGQEVVNLYAEALREISQRCTSLSEDLTPREVQSVLSKDLGELKSGAVEIMTVLFERAEFSPEIMARSDYEKMFHVVQEVKA